MLYALLIYPPDATSCDKLAQTMTNQKLPDGKYLLLNDNDEFEVSYKYNNSLIFFSFLI